MSRACFYLALCLAVTGCSRAPTMDSRWRQADIVIDGADGEWPQSRYVLEGLIPVTVGVLNDATHLYLCVVTADRALQRRVLFSGLEVWLDPRGGTRRHVGLRLPGLDRAAAAAMSAPANGSEALMGAEERGARRGPGGPLGGELSGERLEALFSVWEAQSELRLVDADNDDDEGTRLQPSARDPLQLRVHYERGRLVLEARWPLSSHGYPTYAVPSGGPVGVALRLPQPPQPTHGEDFRPGLDPSGGGMEGGGRPGGGMRGERNAPVVEPLQQWTRITLRAQP